MLTKGHQVMSYIRASAGRSNLGVVFEDKNQPRHSGDTIYLPKITSKTTEKELISMMASTDHEVAHDQYSDFAILKEKGICASNSPLGFIWNFIEDSRVNYLEADEYPGFQELWEQSCPELLGEIRKNSEATTDKTPTDVLVAGLFRWDSTVSADMFPLCSREGLQFPKNEKLDKLLADFSERLLKCQAEKRKVQGTKLTYELARDIFKAMGCDPDKEEERVKKEAKEAGDKPAEGEGEETEGKGKKGKKADKKEGKGESKEGEVSEEGDEDVSEDEWKILKIKFGEDTDKKLLTKHDTLETERMSKVGLMYETDKSLGGWTLTPFNEFVVVDYAKKTDTSAVDKDFFKAFTNRFFDESYATKISSRLVASENFAQQIRRELQIRSRVQYQYGVKKGKLDSGRLARIVLNVPGYSERVFKNKMQTIVLDAAVSLLIDMSGSMSGEKVLYATGAAVLVNKVCQVLQIPIEIAGFTDVFNEGEPAPLHFLYKTFNSPHVADDKLISRIGCSSTHMCGNPDGENILFAYNRLIARREKKRLLIVMSDGQPAASKGSTGLGSFTLAAIQEIEARKQIDIYGLGLLSPAVTEFYKSHSVVESVESIPQMLLQLIERKLFV